ncbi:tyrosine-type recombinase/integrase [Paraburkholderia sp. BCC1885]|uniref:tyrosine-type recombinase/integrase n=1 Tax=Paraburkholderia sp. BCC1885 TaxID=2562669 RepID=UPI001183D66D|nr:tyrosine-type recombinase/integrase [Paraburkholderia sp. BCC1885]
MASITPHKNGWRAQVYVSGIRDSRILRTQREAKAWASAREIELQAQKTQSPGDRHTVAEMLRKYGEDVSPQKQGSRSEFLRLEAFITDFPKLAALKLSEFKTPQLVEWRDARLKVVKSSSVVRDVNLIRNAFTIARQEWHWMEHNPFEGFRVPQEGPPRTRRVDPWKEVRPLCRHLKYRTGHAPATKSQEVALAFMIGLRTAMRAGEILSLGKASLDLKKRTATVHHKMEYLTGRPRVIPLSKHAVRLLKPIADREQCFTVTSASLDALFRKARDQLKFVDMHFHDTRAEALTRMARKVDVMTLAKISGHKDLRILQEVYYRESAEDIAARL